METNVDTIFDELKSEMLLVKKDTIAGWVEEFGGEPAEEDIGDKRKRRLVVRANLFIGNGDSQIMFEEVSEFLV